MSVAVQHLARIGALTRRDLRVERSYHLRHATRLLALAVTATVLLQVSELVGPSLALARYGGSYFDFAIVGLAVMSIAHLGIGTFNQGILREQTLGTLEVLLVTPTPLWVLLAGSFTFPLLLTAVDLVLYLGVGLVVLGGGTSVGGLLLAVPLAALTLASFCAFGILGASLVVLVKRGDPLTAPLLQLTGILSGALFPVSQFPGPVEALARAFPAYYGIEGLREALLARAGLAEVLPELLALGVSTLVLLPLAVHVFGRALATARRTGTLGNY